VCVCVCVCVCVRVRARVRVYYVGYIENLLQNKNSFFSLCTVYESS